MLISNTFSPSPIVSFRGLCVSLLLLSALHGIGQQRPVIVIMADQLRADVIGEKITPNIVALMNEGVSFSRAYCNAPLCAPSRASFFTGMYPNKTGSLINPWSESDRAYGRVRPGTPSLYSLMEEQWDSYHVGKQHFFTSDSIERKPGSLTRWVTQEDYSKWVNKNGKKKPGGKQFKTDAPEIVSGSFTRLRSYSTPKTSAYKDGLEFFLDHYITNECINAIKGRDRNKPFLLNAMYLAPHPPFDIPEPYFSMYGSEDFPVPENVGEWYPGQSPLQKYSLTGFIGSRYDRNQWLNIWPKYLGLVKLLDDEVGRLVRTLKEEGLYDDALILFTSDHGEMLGSHGLWQKMFMYEESVKVPLIIKMPEPYKMKGKEIGDPVSLVDVLPTILELNGQALNESFDGRSLLSLMEGKPSKEAAIFIQYDGNGSLGSGQRCLIKGDDKLIVDTFKEEVFIELYDLGRDREEKVNLALHPENKSKVEALFKELVNKMSDSGDRLSFSTGMITDFLGHHGIQD